MTGHCVRGRQQGQVPIFHDRFVENEGIGYID